jgi:gliding motility-associated-like protein
MIVYIFDRYAKLLTSFGATSSGWDGNYNGRPMPSDDYWFLVELPNGKIHRGHFALKR